jgi:hypothetical protein
MVPDPDHVANGGATLDSSAAAKPLTFTDRVSQLVLSSCRTKDSNAHISSVLRDSHGRTVVRIRGGEESRNPLQLLGALKELWPLASTAVIENALDGSVEAQIVVPREADERAHARRRARKTRVAECLWVLGAALLLAGLALYAAELVPASADEPNSSASTDREL